MVTLPEYWQEIVLPQLDKNDSDGWYTATALALDMLPEKYISEGMILLPELRFGQPGDITIEDEEDTNDKTKTCPPLGEAVPTN